MKHSHRIASAAVGVAAAFAYTAPAALALPPDPVPHCPPGYHMEDEVCVKNTPPPPPAGHRPVVTLTTPRQTTDQTAVRIAGRATDADHPATPLIVRITVDGKLVTTVTADQPDPPVATPHAAAAIAGPVLPGHSLDVTVPAPADVGDICVTAINVGPAGPDSTACALVDRVLEFRANTLTYDVANLHISGEEPLSLDRVTNTNHTDVQQSTTISGEKTVETTHGWSITTGLKVTLSGSVGIPLVAKGSVSVEGSFSFSVNRSETTTTKFAWSQPVLVPPHSQVVASIGVTKTKLTVPYSLVGNYLYRTGFMTAGAIGGTFTGVNGHDLEVRLEQSNLDGSPADAPVAQPKPTLRRSLVVPDDRAT